MSSAVGLGFWQRVRLQLGNVAFDKWMTWAADGWIQFRAAGMLRGTAASGGTVSLKGTPSSIGTASLRGFVALKGPIALGIGM